MIYKFSKFFGWKTVKTLRTKKTPFILKGASNRFLDVEIGLSQFNDIYNKKISTSDHFLVIAKDGLLIFPNDKERCIPEKSKIDELYNSGHTIAFNRVSKEIPCLCEQKRRLEMLIGEKMGNSIFMTPANSQGFPAHFDPVDIFIVQMNGCKEWTLYEKLTENPIRPKAVPYPRNIIFKGIIKKGDVLYIPKGVVHEGKNKNIENQPSIHISFGVLHKRDKVR